MKWRWMILAALVGRSPFGLGDPSCRAGSIPARVLYAGESGGERSRDFVAFLKGHFTVVGEANYLTLREDETRGYDVLVLDWPGLPPRDPTTGRFLGPTLPERFALPTVLIGSGPLAVARSFHLKLDDLCICLGDSAHGIDRTHEVFSRPFKIDVRLEDRPTPPGYVNWPTRSTLGKTIPVWKVQDGGWSLDRPEDLSTVPGIVSDPFGFTDSPDTEVISGGLNSKCYDAIAIGRHGNFLLWGFQAAPARLLPEARECLVNCICYIRKFADRPPIVPKLKPYTAREWALVYAFSYRLSLDHDAFLASLPPSLRDNRAEAEKLFQSRRDSSLNMFPADLRQRIGTEPDAYIAYYRDNLEYLRYTGDAPFPFTVDEDVRRIAVSNRDPVLLARCVEILEKGGDATNPMRLLRLYTAETFDEPARWRAWLSETRGRLFFSDVGGYKFRVLPGPVKARSRIDESNAGGQIPPSHEGPVSVRIEVAPKAVRPGEDVTLRVEVEIAPGWHIDPLGGTDAPPSATRLGLIPPDGLRPIGDWKSPEPRTAPDGKRSYLDRVVFERRLHVEPTQAPGRLRGEGSIRYQACDPFRCLLPVDRSLAFEVDVRPANAVPVER